MVRYVAGVLSCLGVLSLSGHVEAACPPPPVQVQEVRILACEDPAPYVRLGVDRMDSDDLEWFGAPRDIVVERIGSKEAGAVLVLIVMREITLQWHIANDGERYWEEATAVSPWVRVDRSERVWWPFTEGQTCAEFPRLKEMQLFLKSPCCDTIPSTDLPCVADLDRASEIPDWVQAVIAGKPKPK